MESGYRMFERGEKNHTIRAPDFSDPGKRYTEARVGDIACIVPVGERNFERMDLPALSYRIEEVIVYEKGKWEDVVERVINDLGLEYLAPGLSFVEYVQKFREWGLEERIERNGLVVFRLGEMM